MFSLKQILIAFVNYPIAKKKIKFTDYNSFNFVIKLYKNMSLYFYYTSIKINSEKPKKKL